MAEQSETAERVIAPVPRITIQAFCELSETAAMIEAAADDRRLQRARVKVRMGGGAAAIEPSGTRRPQRHHHRGAGRPFEAAGMPRCPGRGLRRGHRVVVIGHLNDVTLYRQLLQRGVSDYLMAPVKPLTLIASISEMFTAAGVKPIGRTISVFGVRGASAPRPWRTIWLGPWRAARACRPSSPISTSPSAPLPSTSTRIRRRASRRRSSPPSASTPPWWSAALEVQ